MNKLSEYNEKLFNDLKEEGYQHFQIGFFNSNLVLFVGQNPGMPFTDEQTKDIQCLQNYSEFEDREAQYTEDWKKSLFGSFLGRVINNHWELISFTNLVKIPTTNNEQPDDFTTSKFLLFLKVQIGLLRPHLIVCLGKLVGQQFGLTNFYDSTFYSGLRVVLFPHPSYILRQGDQYVNGEVMKMRNILNLLSIGFDK